MSTYHYDTKVGGTPTAGQWGTYLALKWDGTDVDGNTYSETGTKTYWASPDGSNWIQATEDIVFDGLTTYLILDSIIELQIESGGWTDLYLTFTDPGAGSTQLDVREFPTYHPTDRRYVHGEWPMTRHRFMSNTEQRVLHASAKTGQELRLTYANQTTEVVEQFAIHYDQVLGSQYAFDLPREVLIGWEGGNTLVGIKQKWKYKTDPLITSQRGLYATLQITLVAASTPDSITR